MFEMMVPGHKVGLIIGKAGETIKQLQEQSGAKIVIIQVLTIGTIIPRFGLLILKSCHSIHLNLFYIRIHLKRQMKNRYASRVRRKTLRLQRLL